ncbi:MAG: ABC transporter ATP-binding protein [Coriobacteriia bacterium]|nr:ABC transporter ATP-binding protein [Coriobacteriia bacterium]
MARRNMEAARRDQGFSEMREALSKTLHLVGRYKYFVLIAVVFAILSSIAMLLGPNQVGQMTDVIKDGLVDGIDMKRVSDIGMILIVIYCSSALLSFFQQFIMVSITAKVCQTLRTKISEKINRLPIAYFNNHEQGDIMSRVTNDVQTLRLGLSRALPTMITALTQFLLCILMMLLTEWRLTLCIFAVLLVGLIALAIIMSKSQKYFTARQYNLGELNGYIEEMYYGQSIVRFSRAESDVKKHFFKLNDAVYECEWKSQFISGILQPVMAIVGNLGYAVVCVVGAIFAISHQIEFGVIIAFIMFCRLFTSPLTQIAQGLTDLQSASAASHRVFGFLDEKELDKENPKYVSKPIVKGDVDFSHVKFAYPDKPEKTIIKDFSVHVKPGQKVAIVGETGAGKTTLVNLIMRFYDNYEGSIKIDGIDTRDMSRDNVHKLFGMVLQNTWLFEGTVRENLVYNLKNVDDEKLEYATRACGIYNLIDRMPDKFDTMLSDRTQISEGQKQLFTIARAMIQNSPMLILDEATSSVDTRTEIAVQEAMDKLTEGRTSFVIAHRLSTIRNADLILVIKDGDIIEKGTHEQLLDKDGYYADLYNSQFSS